MAKKKAKNSLFFACSSLHKEEYLSNNTFIIHDIVIPIDVLLLIFKELDPKTLTNIMLTCKNFLEIAAHAIRKNYLPHIIEDAKRFTDPLVSLDYLKNFLTRYKQYLTENEISELNKAASPLLSKLKEGNTVISDHGMHNTMAFIHTIKSKNSNPLNKLVLHWKHTREKLQLKKQKNNENKLQNSLIDYWDNHLTSCQTKKLQPLVKSIAHKPS